ncbi:MAG: aminoacyl--tRNA ligase-related protein [Patescibacteria group bacterium]
MKYSKLFTKTKKTIKDDSSINAKLLIQGGFVDQVMAGAYTYLPLGLRVLNKIENIVRTEMNKIGAEVLMPAVVPTELWEKTGRLETVDVLGAVVPANDVAKSKNDSKYVISPTHEEVVTPLAQKYISSYKDMPCAYYQIQTKFRNEPRAKSGLLRCREFRMKDLYSFHTSPEDLKKYYEASKDIYFAVYEALGIKADTYLVKASGGDFTKDYSHEFQLRVETGEDTIYRHKTTGECFNKEIAPEGADESGDYEVFKACEIGNIFPLNTKFSDAFGLTYKAEDGSDQKVYMGCYGIGTSRIMGVMVEKYNDGKGIIWPTSVAPYKVHLTGLDLHDQELSAKAEKLYTDLKKHFPDEVLFDDRIESRAGEKFADADLIGCPLRVVISKRSGDRIEVKERAGKESTLLSVEEFVSKYA